MNVKMPSGQIIKFPDTMSKADINKAIETDPSFKPFLIAPGVAGVEKAVPGGKKAEGNGQGSYEGLKPLPASPEALFSQIINSGEVPGGGAFEKVKENKELLLKGGGGMIGTTLGAPFGPVGMLTGGTLGTMIGGQGNDLIDAITQGRLGFGEGGFSGDLKRQASQILRPGEMKIPFTDKTIAWPEGSLPEGFTGEVGGPVAVKTFGKVLKPFSGEVSPAATAAQKNNIPLRTSTVADGKIANFGEFVAETTIGGKAIMSKRVQQIKVGLQRMADDFKEQLPFANKSSEDLKKITNEAFENAKVALEKGSIIDEALPSGGINMTNTVEALKKMRLNFPAKSTSSRKFIEEYILKGDNWTPQDVINFQSNTKKVRNLAKRKTTERFRETLLDTIKADVGDDAFEQLSLARQAAKNGYYKKKVQKIINLFDSQDRAGKSVIHIDAKGNTVLDPAELVLKFDKQKKTLKEALRTKDPDGSFNDDIFENLSDFVDIVRLAAKDVAKTSKTTVGSFAKSKATLIAGLTQGGKLGDLGSFLGPLAATGLIVGEGAGPFIAWSMTKPRGVIKKWLTTGFGTGPLVPALTKEATRAGIIQSQIPEQSPAFTPSNISFEGGESQIPKRSPSLTPANISFQGAGGL